MKGRLDMTEARGSLRDAILMRMAERSRPVGARSIRRHVGELGFDVSESTVARVLSELDGHGVTEVVDNKGRILTAEGRRAAVSLRADAHREEKLNLALDIRAPEGLLDLLVARRGLEREAARSAAERASADERRKLADLASGGSGGQEDQVGLWHERMSFHAYLGVISHNTQLQALSKVLFDERLTHLEHLIFLVGLQAGTIGRCEEEHVAIAQAVDVGDADLAEMLTVQHIERMAAEIEAFTISNNASAIRQLFEGTPPSTQAPEAP